MTEIAVADGYRRAMDTARPAGGVTSSSGAAGDRRTADGGGATVVAGALPGSGPADGGAPDGGAPDLGLFGPGSVTWRIHADPSMLVGGLRALLIQALHPLAMAGVDQHSDYRTDPWGRLQRTSEYVMTVTFADTATAVAAGAHVRRLHARVKGVDPVTGEPYRAGDPELLGWIHNVLVHSLLKAYRRYAGSISRADGDRYVAEMVRMAEVVGLAARHVPKTEAELKDYLEGVKGLQASAVAREGMRMVLTPPMPLPLRPLWAIPGAAAVGLMPRRLRAMYGLPWFPPADPAVRLSLSTLFRSLRLVLPDPPPLKDTKRRAAVSAPASRQARAAQPPEGRAAVGSHR